MLGGSAVVAGIALFILDELLFGIPIIAFTKITTPAWAFIVMVPIYFLFDFFLGTATLNGVRRWKGTGQQNKWSHKFSETQHTKLGRFARSLVVSGGALGFVVCSWLGTAFLTMPLVYLLGQRKHLQDLTALSALIYSLTFVGQNVGIGVLIS